MGIKDFDGIFDSLDLTRKGYITAAQLHEFCEVLYFAPLCLRHVEDAIKCKLGSGDRVTKRDFLPVFQDIERRRSVEEQAYWNFQALDYSGSGRITLRDTLLLFREIHGDKFSLAIWKRFLSSRVVPTDDVYFDEIRFWLCTVPTGTPCSEKEFKQEQNRMELRQVDTSYDSYITLKEAFEDEESRQREKEEQEEEASRHAERKLNKWNIQGVEAMLFDDGLDPEEGQVKVKSKAEITMGDLNELLELKYNTLRDRLMLEMVKQASAMEDEQKEMLKQLRRKGRQLGMGGRKLTADDTLLPGATSLMPSTLTGLMGELRPEDKDHRLQMEDLKNQMRMEGKSPAEIGAAVRAEYETFIQGDKSCLGLLAQLNQRYQRERETMLSVLQTETKHPLNFAMIIEYGRLLRQLLLMEEELKFVPMATAVGLAERAADPKNDRFDWDRSRSERLAEHHLQERKDRKQVRTPETVPDEDVLDVAGNVDVQMEVIKEVTRKHFYEREALVSMLQGKESAKWRDKARKTTKEERRRQLQALKNQHKAWKSNVKKDPSFLSALLLEAVWLKSEERRADLEEFFPNISEGEMCEVILADLQQRQGIDCEITQQTMLKQSKEELLLVLKKECKLRLDEHFDNIAFITLGPTEISPEDEEYVKVLDQKYEALRRRIFLMGLRDEHGADWKEFPKERKQKDMKDRKKAELRLRGAGLLVQMEALVGPRSKMLPSLRLLMGEEKEEFQQRLVTMQHHTGAMADETPADPSKVTNVLADLVPRHDNEQAFLLSWLQSPEAKSIQLRSKRMKIVQMRVETLRVEMEEDFELAALSSGLMERIAVALTERTSSDVQRQDQLSRKRVQLRRKRLMEKDDFRKEPEIDPSNIPKKGDITGLQIVFLHEMLKRHQDERELILHHLQDESLDDLLEAASLLTVSERQKRLAELQGKRQNLNLNNPDDREENVVILEEAAAIRAISVRAELSSHGRSVTMEEVAIALLAELQEEQDKELALTLQQAETMDEDELRMTFDLELDGRRQGKSWNVLLVLTRYQGDASDEELLKALEQKYKLLQDKLLTDSLIGRLGNDAWQKLPYKDKQQRLAALTAQATEQKKLGRVLPAVLGEGFRLEESVSGLIGVLYSHAFRNRVKGQLSLGTTSNFHLDEDPGVREKRELENPLKDLIRRHEEEKKDLMKQLRGQTDEYFSEADRRVQLVRFRRERTLADLEETFTFAAILVGLLERQQEEIKFRLKKDKQRYEKLAKKTMQDLGKQKRKNLKEETIRSKDITALLDNIMLLLEGKHIQERELFCQILADTVSYPEEKEMAALSSQQQRADKLAELKTQRQSHLQERKMENVEVLCLAAILKKENLSQQTHMEGDHHVTDDVIDTMMMSDLLEVQNSEAQRILRMLVQQTQEQITQYQGKILADKKMNLAENVAFVIFSLEKGGGDKENDLVEALKGKYDALKDKLIAEALMKELGDMEWNQLSEKERQRKILELKLKEKQLRKEGRIEEANALLNELLKDQDSLRRLMGDSAVEQKRKLQERLERRKRRLAQGMTEEECDELEEEERLVEEERDRRRKKNILLDLEHRFEEEKDELLRRLYEASDGHDREVQRQANLARLRREERLARREGKFQAAALILGLAEKYDKELQLKRDEERQRQVMLAKQRLEARRLRRQQGKNVDDEEEEDVVVDTNDTASLQEALARDLDKCHRKERELLMKLLDENSEGPSRNAARDMSDEERENKAFELAELHKLWLQTDDRKSADEEDIFKEAVGVVMETVKHMREADGQEVTEDDLQTGLLADLQERQKQESIKVFKEIEDKDLKALQNLYRALSFPKEEGDHSNIVAVLLRDRTTSDHMDDDDEDGKWGFEEDGEEASEKRILKALGQKYDAIKDKLLIEALIKEHGEAEWRNLTEKERQKKLVELKLKERQLRKQGKLDEIANIIGSHLEDEKLLDELLSGSKKNQQQRLAERLARRKELIAEREAAGLETDEKTIDEILDQEEEEQERKRRRNILEDLQKNYDDEKARLLKSLANQKDRIARERERQITLAKLKRDQRKLKRDEKLDSVALMMATLKAEGQKREEMMEAERERQRAIARQRLEDRRQRKNKALLTPAEMEAKLLAEEEQSKLDDTVNDTEGQSVQESLQQKLEGKQEEEMNLLFALLETAKTQTSLNAQVSAKEDEELKLTLTKMEQEQTKWRNKSRQVAMAMKEEDLVGEEGQRHMAEVAQNRSEQTKLLTDALVHRLEVERRLVPKKQPELTGEKLEEEILVSMVTDLQEKQTMEANVIQRVMKQQDDATLREMKKTQHMACREGWFDNLTDTIFHLADDTTDIGPDGDDLEESLETASKKFDEDFEKEKDKAIENAKKRIKLGEEIDIDAMLKKLNAEHEYQKQKRLKEIKNQRVTMRQRLEARKRAAREKEYEDLAALQMIKMAREQQARHQEKYEERRAQNSSMLQQRLAQRRDARKEAQNVRETLQTEREGTLDHFEEETKVVKPKTVDNLPPPPFGMQREKTVVDVDVSDEQKQAIMSQLYIQQSNLQRKITEQQARQEEMLKRRLAMRQNKQKDEAAELLSLGQRQKTILDQARQEEKDRQMQKIRDRAEKARLQREPSPATSKRK